VGEIILTLEAALGGSGTSDLPREEQHRQISKATDFLSNTNERR